MLSFHDQLTQSSTRVLAALSLDVPHSLFAARQCPRQRRPLIRLRLDFRQLYYCTSRSPPSLIMKLIFFCLTLVSVAAAQVVNGISMVSNSESSATAQPSSLSSRSTTTITTTITESSITGSPAPSVPSAIYTTSAASMTSAPYVTSGAPPSQYTPPPSSSTSFYQQMPYESYKGGGYKSLDCGYGYTKSEDGHCTPESWVSLLF